MAMASAASKIELLSHTVLRISIRKSGRSSLFPSMIAPHCASDGAFLRTARLAVPRTDGFRSAGDPHRTAACRPNLAYSD